MRVTLMSIAAALTALLLSSPVPAQVTVMPGESIQAAVDAAAPGATILVEAGRYNETVNLRGKALTLRSLRGPHVTFIDGEGLDNVVLRCVSGETSATLIEGFTITNGAGAPEYTSRRAGGLLVRCSSPTIRNCTFEANATSDFGGGAYVIGETVDFTPCAAGATFENCRFVHNQAGRGAGLSTYAADVAVSGCAFLGNTAGSEGGGLRVNGGNLTIITCEFVGNTANRGGAVFMANTSPEPASATIVNCTITSNVGRIARGGIQVDLPLTMTNSILSGNTPPEIYHFVTPAVTHCLIEGGFAGTGNFDADPIFRRAPSPGADNLWGTADDDFGDLRLAAASPCLDRADGTAALLAGAVSDMHGCPRDVNDPGAPDGGTGLSLTIDLGAHERRAPITVSSVGGDFPTIQAAINAAEPCDEIIVGPGTYNEAINFLGKALTVRGGGTRDQTVLSGAGLTTSIVQFVNAETTESRLENVTITGSRGLCEAGGVRIVDASPTLVNCRITDNQTRCPEADNWGAGIFIDGGAPSIIGCEIDSNIVGFGDGIGATFGAGVYAEEAAVTVIATTIRDNTTDNFWDNFDQGGGLCHFGPYLVLEGCQVLRNRIDSNGPNQGGGVYSDADQLTVTNSIFIDNFAGENSGAFGGGLCHTGAFGYVLDCEFTGNHVGSLGGGEGVGGGLYIENGVVEHTSFTGNTATLTPTGSGGGMAMRTGEVKQCYFEANVAFGPGAGGGLVVYDEVNIAHTVFRENQSGGIGGGLAVDHGTATVEECTFDYNAGIDYFGGGGIGGVESQINIRSSFFHENDAGEGGAFYLINSPTQIASSHFFSNAAARGGAIYNSGSSVAIDESTFTENVGCGGALWTDTTASIQGSTFSLNFPNHIQGPFVDGGGNTGLPYADLDQSGAVNVFDLLAYLNLWFDNGGQLESLLAYLNCWFSGDPAACPGSPGACE